MEINFETHSLMKKSLFSMIFILFSTFVSAEEEKAHPPLDPEYMGLHGMVLLTNGSKLFAYHLPTYNKPHDAQILYKIKASDPAVTYMTRDADLVTAKPQRFNLERLIRGEELTVIADIYIGHFERGGMLVHKGIELTFDEQLYVKKLTELEPSTTRHKYDAVSFSKNERIFIHQITKPPSFDHVVIFSENIACLTEFYSSSAVPQQHELLNKLSLCGPMKPVYYETHDFQQ